MTTWRYTQKARLGQLVQSRQPLELHQENFHGHSRPRGYFLIWIIYVLHSTVLLQLIGKVLSFEKQALFKSQIKLHSVQLLTVGWRDGSSIDDVRRGEKKGEQTAVLPSFVLRWSLSSPASYPVIETGTNNRLAVFWLFVVFAESQIKAFERGR